MTTLRVLLLLALIGVRGVAAATDPEASPGAGETAPVVRSLSLEREALIFEGRALGTDALFARIDSLEAILPDAPESERADLLHRLAELYLATDLMKHRRHALQLLDDSLELDPTRLESARVRATMAHRMRYAREAQGWLEEIARDFADDPRGYAMLGRFHFLEGRRRMLVPRFEASRDAFRRAVEIDSTYVDAWRGMAIANMALNDDEGALQACARLAGVDSLRVVRQFVEAAALVGQRRYAEADSLFRVALEESDQRTRDVFADARGILDERDLEKLAETRLSTQVAAAAMQRVDDDWRPGEPFDWRKILRDDEARDIVLREYWRGQDSSPTQEHNPRALRFLRRLVVADLLFGDPDAGRRGWDTEMGQAIVRWGRPTSVFYDSGSRGSIADELEVAGVALPPGESVPQGTRLWVWTYRQGETWFSLMFTDPTMNARWQMSSGSAYAAEARRRSEPLTFFDDPQMPTPFSVSVQRTVFSRLADESVLETYVGVRPLEGFAMAYAAGRGVALDAAWPPAWSAEDTLATLEWALFDLEGHRLDFARVAVKDRHRRARLHQALGLSPWPETYDPFVVPIAARVPPGLYEIAVEVTGPHGIGHEAVRMEVDVPPPWRQGLLAISDLEIASAFQPYAPGQSIPLRYVKFGQAVVPVPDLRVPVEATEMGVYFELHNLGVDLTGRTSFDVTYEVFAADRDVRGIVSRPDFDRAQLERVEPLTMTFVGESTGRSQEGVVVKGARLDVSGLGRGDYVLVVTVFDRVGRRSDSQAMAFRKLG